MPDPRAGWSVTNSPTPQPARRTLNLLVTTWGPGGPEYGRSRFHAWLRHRRAFKSCRVHCGCDCGGSWCRHNEFRVLDGRCAHCGYGVDDDA